MNDMSATIVAKSDQINAADLIGIRRTITVREVRIKAGDDQPVTIMVEGDRKAFRPCKGVRRLLVRVWGPDANKYIGQSLTIYCDPTVTWAGKEEGGIRVSHMTGLDEKIVEYMRTSREKTKPYEILPLQVEQRADKAATWAAEQIAAANAAADTEALDALTSKGAKAMGKLQSDRPELHAQILAAYEVRRAALSPATDADGDDPYATDQPTDRTGFVAGIERRIAEATTLGELDEAAADLNAGSDGLGDDVIASLDVKLAARRRALVKPAGGEG